jgi:hypothetical protein
MSQENFFGNTGYREKQEAALPGRSRLEGKKMGNFFKAAVEK